MFAAIPESKSENKLKEGSILHDRANLLRETMVGNLIAHKPILIDISAHASVRMALSTLQNNQIAAIPVFGAKRHWIAAGGVVSTHDSNVSTSNPDQDKVYIGILTMQDIVQWMIDLNPCTSIQVWETKLDETRVSDIVGRAPESRSLWITPSTAPLQVIAHPLTRGIHRWLVEGPANQSWDQLSAKSGASSMAIGDVPIQYRLCTQTDVVQFCHSHQLLPDQMKKKTLNQLRDEIHWSSQGVICVPGRSSAIEALKALVQTHLDAVAVVSTPPNSSSIWFGTLATSELNDPVTLTNIMTKPDLMVQDVIRSETSPLRSIVVSGSTTLEQVWNAIVSTRAHRAWIVEPQGNVIGVLTLTDLVKLILNP